LTFKDLQKLVHSQTTSDQIKLFERLRDKPFWIWDLAKAKEQVIIALVSQVVGIAVAPIVVLVAGIRVVFSLGVPFPVGISINGIAP
jgi:hypothetical protein